MTAADFVNLGIDSTQPPLQQDTDEAYLLLDRSRVLRMAAKQVSKKLNIPMKWEPLELSLIEFDGYRNTATVDGGASPNFFQLMGAAWHANLGEHLFEIPDTVDPKNFQTEAEMLVDTFFFNVMGQDEATGKLKLGGIDGDQIDLDWEQPIAQQQLWADIETILREFSSAMGGRFIDLPTWQGLLGEKKLVIVHPLGGCPIGTTHEDGVVNEFGQAFDAGKSASSKAVLPGLYVVDGAVIPGALAANPSLTISAQALKSVNKAVA